MGSYSLVKKRFLPQHSYPGNIFLRITLYTDSPVSPHSIPRRSYFRRVSHLKPFRLSISAHKRIPLFIRHNQSLSEKAGHNHYNHNKGYQILLHTASSFVSSESKLTFANICSVSNSITRTYVCQFFFGIFRTKVCFFPYFMVLCIQMKKGGIS